MIPDIFRLRLLALAAPAIAFLFSPLPVHGQSEITLDDFISLAMNGESDVMRQILMQDEINRLDYSLSQSSYRPSLSVSVNGPTYSKSVSPVTQPDGSVCYRRVNSMSESLSINLSVPINATGGSLSFSNGLSAYSHFAGNISTLSLSLNYCRLSLSQPLNFYSESKWDKRLLSLSNMKTAIENADAYADECKECVSVFFDMVICQAKDSLLRSELSLYNLMKERVGQEVALGRSLETEFREVCLKCEDVKLRINDNGNYRRKTESLILSKYGVRVENMNPWRCPDFPIVEFSLDSIESAATAKLGAVYAYSFESYRKNIERLKRTKWGTPSLSANMGLSSSASEIGYLKNNVDRDYGAGVSFSLSITGLSNNEKEMKKALLQNELLSLKHKMRQDGLLIELQTDLCRMAVLRAEYLNNKSREMVLLDKREAVVSKYQLRRILLDGVEEVMSKVFQVRISQIENIRDAFLLKLSLMKRMTY